MVVVLTICNAVYQVRFENVANIEIHVLEYFMLTCKKL